MIDFADTSLPYQIVRDFFLIWVDQIWESSTTKSGIITVNDAYHEKTTKNTIDAGASKRRYGYVIDVPSSFSDRHVEMIDPGLPNPRAYVGHEHIQHQVNMGQRGFRRGENAEKRYYPSTFERYESVTISDVAREVQVKVGDLVYFLPTATEMDRYMGEYKGGHLFSVSVTEILCKMGAVFQGYNNFKQKQIIPQGRWVFVDVDKKDWTKTTIAGMEVIIAPEGETLQGRVVAGHQLDGKRVMFEKDADAPIVVEGRELSVMEIRDVLATIKQ